MNNRDYAIRYYNSEIMEKPFLPKICHKKFTQPLLLYNNIRMKLLTAVKISSQNWPSTYNSVESTMTLFGKGVRIVKHGYRLIRNTICHSLTALQFPTATKSHSDTSERQAIVRTKCGPLNLILKRSCRITSVYIKSDQKFREHFKQVINNIYY